MNEIRDRPYVVAVTGGRDYDNWRHVDRVLSEIHAKHRIDLLVHGGATGADSLAEAFAIANVIQTVEFRVTSLQWKRFEKSAGPRRNYLMLAVCLPDELVVFPGNDGTTNCARQAKRMGIAIVDESKGTVVV